MNYTTINFRHIILQNKFIKAAIWIKQTGSKPFQIVNGEKLFVQVQGKGESFEDLRVRQFPQI